MFSLVCALPSPASAESCPPLFGWFTGSTAQSDFSGTYMSAVRLVAFADRPLSSDQGVLEISRFSCMLFPSVRGFSDYAGPKQPFAISAAAVLPSSYSEWSRHPDLRAFRSSIAPPTSASVYASRNTSRCPQQDSRSGWIRYFLSCRALASPTTCRFNPAHSALPKNYRLRHDVGVLVLAKMETDRHSPRTRPCGVVVGNVRQARPVGVADRHWSGRPACVWGATPSLPTRASFQTLTDKDLGHAVAAVSNSALRRISVPASAFDTGQFCFES